MEPKVLIETVQLDASSSRQISSTRRTTALLQDRRADIEAAVGEASKILQYSAVGITEKDGWSVTTLEAKFGLTLAAEAGVIISKASAEASLEITITLERGATAGERGR